MENELKKCPFCGGKAQIVICDGEGNIKNEEYEKEPWSGLAYQIAHIHEHNRECPIARYMCDGATMGVFMYESREEAIESWNLRTE